ncbi:hypothetical protein CL621_01380 [archaeon]|nr:hypothetical protein [archaeon]
MKNIENEEERKLVIVTGYKCNNNCRFCYDSNKRKIPDETTNKIISDLREGRKNRCRYVDFIGGEPTIRKDIITLIKYAKKLGYTRICMTTNGRMLSYEPFLEKIINAGLNSVIFSIHGHTPELHDFQTRVKGSFNQLLKGLENVQKKAKQKKIQIGSNTTITKLNYNYLPEIGNFLVKKRIKNSEFIFVDPTGEAYNNFEEIIPKISELSPYLKKLLDIGIQNKIPHWHIRYFPFCYLEEYEDYISEKKSPFQKEIHLGPEFVNYDVDDSRKKISKIKSEKCKECKFDDFCEGVWIEYSKRYGLDELKPIKKISEKKEEIPDTFSKSINILLNYNCNNDCDFCFQKGTKEILTNSGKPTTMSSENLSKLLNYLSKEPNLKVQITGGEPLLYPHLRFLLDNLKEKNIHSNLLTSFTKKLNKSEIQQINQIFDSFLININPCIINKEKYNIVKENLRFIDSAKIKLSYTITDINFDIKFIETFAKELGIKEIRLDFARMGYFKKNKDFNLKKLMENDKEINSFIKKILYLSENFIINFDCVFPKCLSDKIFKLKQNKNKILFIHKCPAPIVVNPDLTIGICTNPSSMNLKITSFDNLNDFLKKQKPLQEIHSNKKKFIKFDCKECEYQLKNKCFGSCPQDPC